MNERLRNIFIRVRDFVRCCKKTTIEIDSMLDDLNKIDCTDNPSFKQKDRKRNEQL